MTRTTRNNVYISIISILILICTVFLSNCGTVIFETTTSTSKHKINQPSPVTIVRDKKTEYKIIYPRAASRALSRAANNLYNAFKTSGIEIVLEHDGGKMNSDVPEGGKEILLGFTNRAESKKAVLNLKKNSFSWQLFGDRLTTVASDDELFEIAVVQFLMEYNEALLMGEFALERDLSFIKSFEDANWKLIGIPVYEGGFLAENLYDAGYGLYHSEDVLNSSKLQLIYNTTEDEFNTYLEKLQKNGYRKTFHSKTEKLSAAEFECGEIRLYVYYNLAKKEVKIIWDKSDATAGIEKLLIHISQSEDTSYIVAYGIYMSDTGQKEPAEQFCINRITNFRH